MDPLELLVIPVQTEPLDYPDLQVARVVQEMWECRDRLDQPDLLDHLGPQGLRVPLVHLVLLVHMVLSALLVQQDHRDNLDL
jgi:hypothetical protein